MLRDSLRRRRPGIERSVGFIDKNASTRYPQFDAAWISKMGLALFASTRNGASSTRQVDSSLLRNMTARITSQKGLPSFTNDKKAILIDKEGKRITDEKYEDVHPF